MNSPRATLLVVDDRPDTLLAFRRILGSRDQTLIGASSGQEALAMLLRGEVAGMVLAVRLPGMDGFETAKRIRALERTHDLPILFVTEPDQSLPQLAGGYALGAVDHLPKPILPELLTAKVKQVVNNYQKRREGERLAETLARMDDEIRWAYQQLELFSYTVAHDLRAPLRTMAGFSQILREEYSGKPFDEERQQFATRIEDGARRMDGLISDLLEYCRIAQTRDAREKIEPGPFIRHVLSVHVAKWAVPGMDISVSEGLPPVLGHPANLMKVFQHLLSNALRYVEPGVGPRVRITHETGPESLRIWIEDNGRGVSPEHHERMFKPFERLDPRTSIGTGMGLAFAKAAMERMGGRIGVESAPGKGTRLRLDLPLWQDEAAGPPEPPPVAGTSTPGCLEGEGTS